jgi:hypothetical protein
MKKFKIEIESSEEFDIRRRLEGASVKTLAVPSGQSLAEAWTLLLRIESGGFLIFSAIPRDLGGWNEAGSLKIIAAKNLTPEYLAVSWDVTELPKFDIEFLEKLVISEAHVELECGLVFTNKTGQELWVVCSTAPGSVSVSFPLPDKALFKPEFPIGDYQRHPIDS